jgi:ferredoxin
MNSENAQIFRALINPSGIAFEAPSTSTLLEAAELAGLDSLKIDSSCRNGTCRTCICQLLSGDVSYRIEWPGLSREEKMDGCILPCVAYPLSNVVIQLPF